MSMREWGVSLANRRPPASEVVPDYAALSGFRGLEIDGRQLGRLETLTHFKSANPSVLLISRLLDVGLCRQAAELTGKIWYDFQAQFSEFCKQSADIKAEIVEIDVDFIRLVSDDEYASKVNKILRPLMISLKEYKLQLCLPLRFPVVGEELSGDKIAQGLGKLMLPDVALAIDLHIHEMQFSEEQIKFLEYLKYIVKVIRVIYEPELGNIPVQSTVERVVEMINLWPDKQVLLFSPVCTNQETLAEQLTLFPVLMEKFKIG